MNDDDKKNLDVNVFVTTDNEVVVKLAGFDCIHDASRYANFLSNYLPLMLFTSTVVH